MVPQDKIDVIRRLLADGKHSQRQIATLTGVSRGTVGAVALGKRDDRLPRPADEWDAPSGPILRCPGCGGLVYSPCRLCRMRDLKATERADRRQTAGRDLSLVADARSRPYPADPRRAGLRGN